MKNHHKLKKTMDKALIKEPIGISVDNEIDDLWRKMEYMSVLMNGFDLNKNLSKEVIEPILKTGFIDLSNFGNIRFGIESMLVEMLREVYVQHYGFIAINEDFIKDLSDVMGNHKVLEVGAGTGFLAKKLQEQNVNLIAVDSSVEDMSRNNNEYGFRKSYTDVLEVDAVKYLRENVGSFETVLMVWPPYDDKFAEEIFKEMRTGQRLIYIGESSGGCTANKKFFNLLDKKAVLNKELTEKANRNYQRFPMIKDRVFVYDI